MSNRLLQRPRGHRSPTVLLAAAVGALGLLAAACSPDSTGTGDAGSASVEGEYGTVSVPDDPQRVAALGLGDADTLLSLGITPVAITPWNADAATDGVGPWAQEQLGDARPAIIDTKSSIDESTIEKTVSADPDLIIAVNAAVDQNTYDKLSAIAPTVVRPAQAEDWTVPWQDATRLIGQAVGRPDAAEQVVADTESRFDAARSEHPAFSEQTGAVVLRDPTGGFYVYGNGDGRGQVLDDLGFTLPDSLRDLIGDRFYAEISAEQMQTLDLDTLVVLDHAGAREALADDPLFQSLNVVKRGDVVFVDDMVGNAMSMPNPLTIPYALDNLVPALAAD